MDSNNNSNNLSFNNTIIHEKEMITSTSTTTTTLNNENIFLKYYWVIILIIIFIMVIFIICIPNICKFLDYIGNKITNNFIINYNIDESNLELENNSQIENNLQLDNIVLEIKYIIPLKNLKTEDTCTICLETLDEETISLPCNHLFHKSCIIPWLENKSTCPLCRTEY